MEVTFKDDTYANYTIRIARTFQNIRLFKKMSVIDNVKVGLHHSQIIHYYHLFFIFQVILKVKRLCRKWL